MAKSPHVPVCFPETTETIKLACIRVRGCENQSKSICVSRKFEERKLHFLEVTEIKLEESVSLIVLPRNYICLVVPSTIIQPYVSFAESYHLSLSEHLTIVPFSSSELTQHTFRLRPAISCEACLYYT